MKGDRYQHKELKIVWEVLEKGATVIESGNTNHFKGFTIHYEPEFDHSHDWLFIGNFNKAINVKSLYDKLL